MIREDFHPLTKELRASSIAPLEAPVRLLHFDVLREILLEDPRRAQVAG